MYKNALFDLIQKIISDMRPEAGPKDSSSAQKDR